MKDFKSYSILAYLKSRGIDLEGRGNLFLCSSPFTNDSTWSFAIYPNNTFFCWSSGKHGDIVDLVRHFENCSFSEAVFLLHSKLQLPQHKAEDFNKIRTSEKYKFDYNSFLNRDKEEVEAIFKYAESRRIYSGFLPAYYYSFSTELNDSIKQPALMFIHVDEDLNICGAKFRSINNITPRFSHRGVSGFYILDTQIEKSYRQKKVWICESETSANSLWEYFRNEQVPAVIISMGSVVTPPKKLPALFDGLETKLIIDYDGDIDLYTKRLTKYEHLNAKPVTLILPKGDDINSLYCTNRMYLVDHLLNN